MTPATNQRLDRGPDDLVHQVTVTIRRVGYVDNGRWLAVRKQAIHVAREA